MRFLARCLLLVMMVLAVCSSHAPAQTAQKQGTGIITGRVTVGEKPMANVAVVLFPAVLASPRGAIARATTDYEGRYRLTGIAAGRYNVMAITPTMVGPSEGTYGEGGKAVTLAEGETAEKIDFTLVRGGVITGRVMDADGAPIINERVNLESVDKNTRRRGTLFFNNPFMFTTDDRGIYRIYGLAPGRYAVSVGLSTDEGSVRFGNVGRGYYARTYHPNVTDQAKATIIEVAEGSEASNVDITVGRKSQSFIATGRVVDESGQPVPNVRVGHGSIMQGQNQMGAFGWGSVTDASGRFRIEGLLPGRYAAFVWSEGETSSYTDPVTFEVAEGDVSGLELKQRRGASISGVVVLEGTADRAVLAKLSQLTLGAYPSSQGLVAPSLSTGNVKIAPDGSFIINGLQPGKVGIYLSNYPTPPQGFTLARVERDGVPQRQIEVAPGAQITGVRVVIEYGTGSVRGLVKIENGPLPPNARMMVNARRMGETSEATRRGAQVDSRGHFVIEGLAPGEYELTLQTFGALDPPRRFAPVKQSVTVAHGVESEITLTFDLGAKRPEGGNNE
jgi:protocatechuate 3,4-dioxygenase beta subunit